jgi:hypothetical protein
MSENNPPPPPAPESHDSSPPPPPPPVAEPSIAHDVSAAFSQAMSGGGAVECPAYGSGKLSASDDKMMCTLCHIFSLIIWLWKKDESPAVNAHGKEAVNFLITILILFVALSILSLIPVLGCVMIPVTIIVAAGAFVFQIIGALKAQDGKLYRYPVNLRLIK